MNHHSWENADISSRHARLSFTADCSSIYSLLQDSRLLAPESPPLAPKNASLTVESVTIDSRASQAGAIFVALKGARDDGHRYLEQVVQAGAHALLVSRAWYLDQGEHLDSILAHFDVAAFVVEDTLAALQLWAVRARNAHAHTRFIGVTGSNGKTTTKELLASVFASSRKTWASPGNLNSVIGLPLAMLALPSATEVAIFEMAMSEAGEMEKLADIVRPDVAVITNIGTAHIGNLGSQKAIAEEKLRIFSRFTGTEQAVLPEDDPWLADVHLRGEVRRYGERSGRGYQGWEPHPEGQVIVWRNRRLRLRLLGAHHRRDALAAMETALCMGLDDDAIAMGIQNFVPSFGRGEIIQGRCLVILDCYNANPESMRESILAAKDFPGSRLVAILGDMKELGQHSESSHQEIGRFAAKAGFQEIVLFGPCMKAAADAIADLPQSLRPGRVQHCKNWDELAGLVPSVVQDGDVVLIKGSRSMEMEKLVPLIVGEARS